MLNQLGFIFGLRLGPFRMFDFVGTYLVVLLLSPLLTKIALWFHVKIGRVAWLWLLLPISALVHFAINQETTLTKMLLDPNDYHIVKVLIIFMLIMGIKDIKIISSKSRKV